MRVDQGNYLRQELLTFGLLSRVVLHVGDSDIERERPIPDSLLHSEVDVCVSVSEPYGWGIWILRGSRKHGRHEALGDTLSKHVSKCHPDDAEVHRANTRLRGVGGMLLICLIPRATARTNSLWI